MNAVKLTGIARSLVNKGLIDHEAINTALTESKQQKQPLIDYLVQKGMVAANEIASMSAQEFGVPVMDLNAYDTDNIPRELLDEKLLEKHKALPIALRGNRLFIALADPNDLVALDEYKFASGKTTEPILVEIDKLNSMMDAVASEADAVDNAFDDLDEDLENLDVAEEGGQQEDEASGADETPVVRFVNKILLDAINKGASDIHFEPYEKFCRVRYRVDGMLTEVAKPPLNMVNRIVARVKVMSKMDISEKRVPQDGRIKLKVSKTRAIDFRVNTCPTLFGEKIVLRILDPSSATLGIDALGYEPEQKKLYMDALANPYGMILVTGPTGSGKTVSLYTGLNILNKPETNISTAEDPAEINLAGINQVNMNPKAGLDFASTLRAFLRQDPDIIMVGEIRDLETANIAIKAAQTGHMVMSTLHTNDAPQTLSRLVNMGVPPFNIASAVSLIIAQRLGRRLCKSCKTKEDIPKETLLEEGFTEEDLKEGFDCYKAVGCAQCSGGYKGRVGIYQVMPISEAMGRIIMEGGNAIQIADQADKEGINDLRRSALLKVKQGVTSLAEANRVTKD